MGSDNEPIERTGQAENQGAAPAGKAAGPKLPPDDTWVKTDRVLGKEQAEEGKGVSAKPGRAHGTE